MHESRPLPTEVLLEQRAFLRALARSLLADEHGAEDVVQDACIAALVKPPHCADGLSGGEALRAWLARVTRNLALNRVRERDRRAWREEQTARADAVPSESEVDARLQAQRRVVEAVLALREPYKSAIWMRFYDGLPPREIARRVRVPVETVKSRIKRGLAELRQALDREFGDRSTWSAALFPLAFGKLTLSATPALVFAGALVLALVAAGGLVFSHDDAARSAPDERAALAVDARRPHDASGIERGASRERGRRSALAEPEVAALELVHGPLHGRTLDARTHEPLGALRITCTDAEAHPWTTETDAQGAFAFARVCEPRACRIEVADAFDGSALDVVDRRAIAGTGEEILRVSVGPAWSLALDPPVRIPTADFEVALAFDESSQPGSLVLVAGVRDGSRDGSPPWVRFARAPCTSLLGASGRSTYRLTLASRDGMWHGDARVIASASGGDEPVRFVLAPSARIGGRIVATDGTPLTGARVELMRAGDERVRTARSDMTGTWSIGAVPSGTWSLSVRSMAHVPLEETVDLGPLESRTLDVRLVPRATSVLEGELRSRTGTHVPLGPLRLRSTTDPKLVLETEASPDRFRFDAVPPGEYELFPPMADAFAWEPASFVLDVPGRAPVFTCIDDVRLCDVVLRAVDAGTGQRIERFQAAIVLDRQAAGRRRALALEPAPIHVDARAGEATFEGIPRGMDGWWLAECEGHASAWGRLDELRGSGARRIGEPRLERAWTCRMWIGTVGDDGRTTPLAGARILTSNGKLLATSLDGGDALLDLLYDPGRISVDLSGWRVADIEGFARGKLRTPMDVHRVWMERER